MVMVGEFSVIQFNQFLVENPLSRVTGSLDRVLPTIVHPKPSTRTKFVLWMMEEASERADA
jgi:hypothetical protein